MSTPTELRAEGLRKHFRRREVVRGVNLAVRTGEIVGLLGPNGAGKTTTFYMIAGFLRPDAGEILLGETRLTGLPVYLRAREGLVYLPQESSVFRRLTVEENIRLVLEERNLPAAEAQEILEELLEFFGLKPLRAEKAYHLSGGERRRVEIMRALAVRPRFLLLDEPFAGIDPLAVSDLKGLLSRLREKGLGLLISDHNVRETLAICDRAYIVAQGEIIASGPPEAVVEDPRVRELYLGEDFRI
ncbi:LPS export ABC transporter ATP-binding protein [Thermosulfurimonas marina]|uniref:Lipopolysaccharide export system ATP-binding protein LptB n=1 Tax=Thermosulfurimonas marina TaxID=2047767 RepID=A0A6H1WV04_9BACT|nr:LPS export ABC transporter ATP-binding protein [Thermosulfurimonas marina]QJA06936.1 LPS export ABC transporter ATP-binding protein [Thermosulfurimonas marina]